MKTAEDLKRHQRAVTMSIEPFSSEVLGILGGYVYVKELCFYRDIDDIDITVLKVKMKDFKYMIDKWIKTKSSYCDRYGEFCGVFGCFYVNDFIDDGQIKLNVGLDNEEIVDVLKVISFDKECDMEHG